MISRATLVGVWVTVFGCMDRPESLVICHNSNCEEPTDPAQDNTPEALAASLALTYAGRPVIDGVEIDLFWHRAGNECLFAHDLDDLSVTTPAQGAGQALADHLVRSGPVSWNGEVFAVFIELKGHVAASKSEKHTPGELRLHAACALEVFATIDAAVATSGRSVDIIFTSFSPTVLAAIYDHELWPKTSASRVHLGVVTGISSPLDTQTHPLSDFRPDLPIDTIEAHPDWILDAQREAYGDLGYDISMWMNSATVEIVDAVERYNPRFISTSEARFWRRWLAR